MKLIKQDKPTGYTTFTFTHPIKGENVEISVRGTDIESVKPRVWKKIKELYKEKKLHRRIISVE